MVRGRRVEAKGRRSEGMPESLRPERLTVALDLSPELASWLVPRYGTDPQPPTLTGSEVVKELLSAFLVHKGLGREGDEVGNSVNAVYRDEDGGLAVHFPHETEVTGGESLQTLDSLEPHAGPLDLSALLKAVKEADVHKGLAKDRSVVWRVVVVVAGRSKDPVLPLSPALRYFADNPNVWVDAIYLHLPPGPANHVRQNYAQLADMVHGKGYLAPLPLDMEPCKLFSELSFLFLQLLQHPSIRQRRPPKPLPPLSAEEVAVAKARAAPSAQPRAPTPQGDVAAPQAPAHNLPPKRTPRGLLPTPTQPQSAQPLPVSPPEAPYDHGQNGGQPSYSFPDTRLPPPPTSQTSQPPIQQAQLMSSNPQTQLQPGEVQILRRQRQSPDVYAAPPAQYIGAPQTGYQPAVDQHLFTQQLQQHAQLQPASPWEQQVAQARLQQEAQEAQARLQQPTGHVEAVRSAHSASPTSSSLSPSATPFVPGGQGRVSSEPPLMDYALEATREQMRILSLHAQQDMDQSNDSLLDIAPPGFGGPARPPSAAAVPPPRFPSEPPHSRESWAPPAQTEQRRVQQGPSQDVRQAWSSAQVQRESQDVRQSRSPAQQQPIQASPPRQAWPASGQASKPSQAAWGGTGLPSSYGEVYPLGAQHATTAWAIGHSQPPAQQTSPPGAWHRAASGPVTSEASPPVEEGRVDVDAEEEELQRREEEKRRQEEEDRKMAQQLQDELEGEGAPAPIYPVYSSALRKHATQSVSPPLDQAQTAPKQPTWGGQGSDHTEAWSAPRPQTETRSEAPRSKGPPKGGIDHGPPKSVVDRSQPTQRSKTGPKGGGGGGKGGGKGRDGPLVPGCNYCRQEDHIQSECKALSKVKPGSKDPVNCCVCGAKGQHFSALCPQIAAHVCNLCKVKGHCRYNCRTHCLYCKKGDHVQDNCEELRMKKEAKERPQGRGERKTSTPSSTASFSEAAGRSESGGVSVVRMPSQQPQLVPADGPQEWPGLAPGSERVQCDRCKRSGHATEGCIQIECTKCSDAFHVKGDCRRNKVKKPPASLDHSRDSNGPVASGRAKGAGKAKSSVTCHNCDQEGHFKRECPKKPKAGSHCARCYQIGHFKADCPHTNNQVDLMHREHRCGLCRKIGHWDHECGTMLCHKCGAPGHKSANCPAQPCKFCHLDGHVANDCPEGRRRAQALNRP